MVRISTCLVVLSALHLLMSGNLIAATLRVPADHATIQKAIDTAQAGDTVLVSAGKYAERVTVKPRVTLRSAGNDDKGKLGLARAEATIIDGGGSIQPAPDKPAAPGVIMAEDAVLDGFTITNVGVYDDAKWKHHHATQGNEQKHEHIGAFGVPAVGIVGVNCTVVHNIVHHNGDTGIGIRDGDGKPNSPRVVRNFAYRNMGGGIGAMNGTQAIIEGNTCFQNFYAGIGHNNASPLVIGNECYENIRAGIGVSEGSSPVVRGNKCHHNRRAGIGIRTGESTSPVVEDNECYENDMAGIGAEEHATPIIRRNKCHRNAMAGIGAQDGAKPVIIGNDCRENRAAGIGARSDAAPLIVNNDSHNNEQAGIGVETKAPVLILANRCNDNKTVAVGLPDGGSALIHGNELSRKGGMPPLVAIRGGAKAMITDNTLRGGGVACILVQGEAFIHGNRLESAGGQGSGVWVWAKSRVDVVQNIFDGFRHGLNASESAVRAVGNTVDHFQKTAIVITKPTTPALVVDNRAISTKAGDIAVAVDEPRGIVEDNRIVSPAAPATDKPSGAAQP